MSRIMFPSLKGQQRLPSYVLSYITRISKAHGTPQIYRADNLSYELKGAHNINLIYKVSDLVYIHVYRTSSYRTYGKYAAIEPPQPHPRLMDLVEFKLAMNIGENDFSDSIQDRRMLLLRKLESIISVVNDPVDYSRVNSKTSKIPVYRGDLEILKYYVQRNIAGLGALEPLILDPWIEDISCRGIGNLYVVHRLFGTLETNIGFNSKESLDKFIIRLSERIGKPVSHSRPIVDATLPDGSRINIVFGEDVSLHGSNFTIRKFTEKPISVTQLIAWNTMDEKMAAYLWMTFSNNANCFVVGETGAGKTSTLNALLAFIPPNYKVVTIEDTAEVRLPHNNWVRELARLAAGEATVSLFDLLKAALRQRPNTIVVGEIRGQEASVFFQALQTGHQGLSTFHAGSVEQVIQRLTGDPIRIPKSFMPNLNLVVIQNAVWRGGKMVRRVTSINEIIGYDPKSDSIIYVPTFVWDSVSDTFRFTGKGASYLLDKIAMMKGLSRLEIRKVYEELELRAHFLRESVRRGIMDYFDFWDVVKKTYEMPLEEAVDALKSGALLRGVRRGV